MPVGAISVGDRVFICSFMQCPSSAVLQCFFDGMLARETFPVCSHTTVRMPEPIHTIIVERRNERRRVADFLIIWATKIEISPGFDQQFRLFSVSLTIKRGSPWGKRKGERKEPAEQEKGVCGGIAILPLWLARINKMPYL